MLEQLQALTALLESEGATLSLDHLVSVLGDALGGGQVGLYDRAGRLLAACTGGWQASGALAETGLAVSPPAGPGASDAHPSEIEAAGSHPAYTRWGQDGRLPDAVAAALLRAVRPVAGGRAAPVTGTSASAVVPVIGSGRRLGTLVVVRPGALLSDPELALACLGAAVAGLALSAVRASGLESVAQARQVARAALRSLSFAEVMAIQRLLEALGGDEGLLVTSRVADRAGIARSVAVNALRKLAAAAVIESRSLGKRGTYLRILNRELRGELRRHRFLRYGPGEEAGGGSQAVGS